MKLGTHEERLAALENVAEKSQKANDMGLTIQCIMAAASLCDAKKEDKATTE